MISVPDSLLNFTDIWKTNDALPWAGPWNTKDEDAFEFILWNHSYLDTQIGYGHNQNLSVQTNIFDGHTQKSSPNMYKPN